MITHDLCIEQKYERMSEFFYVKIFVSGGEIFYIQSTLVISNSKRLYETLRDIRTSTYQICGTEENNKSNNHF